MGDSYKRLVVDYPEGVIIPDTGDRSEMTRFALWRFIDMGVELSGVDLTGAVLIQDDELIDIILEQGVKPDRGTGIAAAETGNLKILSLLAQTDISRMFWNDVLVIGMTTSNADVVKLALDERGDGRQSNPFGIGIGPYEQKFAETYRNMKLTPDVTVQLTRTGFWIDILVKIVDDKDEALFHSVFETIGMDKMMEFIPSVRMDDRPDDVERSRTIGSFLMSSGLTPNELLRIGYDKHNYPIMEVALENGAHNPEIEAELAKL